MHHNYHKQLEKLRKNFLDLGLIVEDRVRKACSAFKDNDMTDIEFVIKSDYEIDAMEIEIEEECLKILALYQPVAKDLRFIIALIKINSEIERIGDYAVKIASKVKFVSEHRCQQFRMDYAQMSEKVLVMLKMSLDALVHYDEELANRVFILDDEVDTMRNSAYDIIKEQLRKQPENAGCLLNCYLISRHLERIADRATNIAEEVIYLVGGEIVRGDRI
nr:phosphate signaling complex protein PhoU [Desulfobulbaceae bacterium]